MRIVLSGGGTGGHITPILTIASALKQANPELELIYIGERSQLATKLLKNTQLKPYFIQAGKWRRYQGRHWWQALIDVKTWLLNLRDLAKFAIGTLQSLWLLLSLRPQAVFINGGYVGLPVGLMAWLLGRALVIHESDAVAGLTNRILGHLARTIAVSWPVDQFPGWRHKHTVFTGNPIRQSLLTGSKPAATSFFKLEAKLPTILVIGGSGGAARLNQAILDNLANLTQNYQLIHSVGNRNLAEVKQQLAASRAKLANGRYHCYGFLDASSLSLAYAACDLIISRAGMNSIAEIAALAKPAIIVPNPHLTGGHQLRNAELLEKYQAALVLDETELDDRLLPTVDELIKAGDAKQLLSRGLAKIAKTDAAKLVADEILALL